ncbi:carbohydrate sulfotransferase 14-like [Portunus trituberculatus]|uniref:carbohydrate sulfotransferase 14-like n=1 Tax=Portunus trituberculatus TaxID=210409 RepID=UPI001E1D0D12|nr:carbohydrate sulfotransferase 14-like [Portunus trituberculatus]
MPSMKQAVAFTASFVLFSFLFLRPTTQGIHILSLVNATQRLGDPFFAAFTIHNDNYNDSFSNVTAANIPREHKNTNETESAGNTTTKAPDADSWMRHMEERFAKRLLRMKAACLRHKSHLQYSASRTIKRNLFYSKKYKLMVCAVAKAGSTTWKTHITAIAGKVAPPEIVHELPSLLASHQLGVLGTWAAVQSTATTTVMTVRHPLDRLVSAYRDKYNDGAPMPSTSRFSKDALKHLARQRDQGLESFTFTEFLKHVLVDQKERLENAHWRNYYSICSPCALGYDFILNMETFTEDLKYIVNKLGVIEIDVGWKLNATPNTTTSPHYWHYYTNVTKPLLRRVLRKYEVDFQMFGYEVPATLKALLR